jgi:hypothetical protein
VIGPVPGRASLPRAGTPAVSWPTSSRPPATEGAKFRAGVCAELRNRGVRDTLIVCCDGLTGFPEAIEATWPQSTVQTCTVHLIRAAMRFVSYQDRKKVAAALKPIYTAPTAEVAETELLLSPSRRWAVNIRRRLRPGPQRGNGSSRSWRSRPSSGKSSTRPTPSNP